MNSRSFKGGEKNSRINAGLYKLPNYILSSEQDDNTSNVNITTPLPQKKNPLEFRFERIIQEDMLSEIFFFSKHRIVYHLFTFYALWLQKLQFVDCQLHTCNVLNPPQTILATVLQITWPLGPPWLWLNIWSSAGNRKPLDLANLQSELEAI